MTRLWRMLGVGPDLIEGNFYFPPSSVSVGVLRDSPTPHTCPWKGVVLACPQRG